MFVQKVPPIVLDLEVFRRIFLLQVLLDLDVRQVLDIEQLDVGWVLDVEQIDVRQGQDRGLLVEQPQILCLIQGSIEASPVYFDTQISVVGDQVLDQDQEVNRVYVFHLDLQCRFPYALRHLKQPLSAIILNEMTLLTVPQVGPISKALLSNGVP